MDTYLNLCTVVYELSKPQPPEDAYKFYRSYVSSAKGSILEPMCGTGRFLLPFYEEGFNVEGFDASEYMLQALIEKAKVKNLVPKVWKGFVEELREDNKYNLIFIPSGSFGLITDLVAAEAALKTFYNILTKDGTLVFEAETLKAVNIEMNRLHCNYYKKCDDSFIISSSFSLHVENNISVSLSRYELIKNNQIIKTEIEEFKIRLYEPNDLMNILKNIGFKVKLIKPFNASLEPDQNDEIVINPIKPDHPALPLIIKAAIGNPTIEKIQKVLEDYRLKK